MSSDDRRFPGKLIDVSVADPMPSEGVPVASTQANAPLGGLLDATRRAPVDVARLARLAFACFLLAPLPWLIAYFFPPLNHDSAALLHYAQRWLAGERLYVDLIDVNPPLIFVLGLVPAAIARLAPIAAPTALVTCVLAWIAFAFGTSWRLLRIAPGSIGGIHRYLLPPIFLFLAIAYPGHAFSQREHLMAVALLPYLLLAQARWEDRAIPRGDTLAVVLFAGLAFSLKPHFMLLPALVEGALLLARGARRSLRDMVPWTLVAVFAAYAAFVALVTPDYLRMVVPLAMSEYRDLGSQGAWGVLFHSQLTPSFLLLLPLAAASLFVRRPLARLVALAAIGCAAIAAIQGRGWPYHVLPPEMLVLLLAAVLLCECVDQQSRARADRRTSSLVVLLVAFMLGSYYLAGVTRGTFWRQAQFAESQAGQLLTRYGKIARQGPVLILSPGIYPHFPFINYAHTKMAMRFMSLWPIQGAYRTCLRDRRMFRSSWEMSKSEAFAWNAVAEDFNRTKPRLVIVDKQPGIPYCHGKDFDYLAYFRSNPLFEAGWSRYQLLEEFDRYRVYVRR